MIIIETINHTFTFIFVAECIILMFGKQFKTYFRNKWNVIDLIIVIVSLFDFVIGFLDFKLIGNKDIIKLIKVFRVLRLIKLVKNIPSLFNQIKTLLHSLPAVLNILSLLGLILYIYAILGVFLFNGTPKGTFINE